MPPKRLGQRAAWILFGALALIHLLALIAPGHWNRLNAWIGTAYLTLGGGLLAALVTTFVLPRPARGPFWLTGLICIALSLALLGSTCGYVLNRGYTLF